MRFYKLTPNLMVEDVDRTLDYYQNVLGFEFVMSVPSGKQEVNLSYEPGKALDFGMVKMGDVELMFQARGSLAEEMPVFGDMVMGGSLTIYMEMEGLDEYVGKIRDAAEIVFEPKTQFYGMREFCIRDCNGYLLAFGERS